MAEFLGVFLQVVGVVQHIGSQQQVTLHRYFDADNGNTLVDASREGTMSICYEMLPKPSFIDLTESIQDERNVILIVSKQTGEEAYVHYLFSTK